MMVKKLLKKILKKEKGKKELKKKLSSESIDAMPEDIQRERGHQQGQIVALEQELEELKDILNAPREKQEVAKFLQQKSDEIEAREQVGKFSLRALFDIMTGRVKVKGVPKTIKLLSHNKAGYFGDLYDITFNPDGQIAVWTLEDGFPRKIKSGSTLKDIFWDYEGLMNSSSHGIFELSLSEKGDHVENIYKDEVNQIIVDANGKYHWSNVDKKQVMALLIDKERIISKLFKALELAERTLSKAGYEINLSKMMGKLNEDRRKVSETLLVKFAKEGNEMVKNWKQIETEVVDKSHQLSIKNQEVDVLNDVVTKIMAKVEKIQGDSNIDKAKKEILGDVDFLVGLLKGEKVTFAKTQEEQQEPLRKDFEAYVEGGQQ